MPSEHKKYIICAVGRTGSTLYASLLREHRTAFINDRDCVSWSATNSVADWNKPIQHTHQIKIFNSAPADYVRIVPIRCILDSALSEIIATATDYWTMLNPAVQEKYKKCATKLFINVEMFIQQVGFHKVKYQQSLQSMDQWNGEKYFLTYNKHAVDYRAFYSYLNIKSDLINSQWIDTRLPKLINAKMSVDKFLLVENLKEILDAYKSIDVVYNFDDEITFNHIENILKEKK